MEFEIVARLQCSEDSVRSKCGRFLQVPWGGLHSKGDKMAKRICYSIGIWCRGRHRALGIPALHLHKAQIWVLLGPVRGVGIVGGEGADRRQETTPPGGTKPSGPGSPRPSRTGERVWPRHRGGGERGEEQLFLCPRLPSSHLSEGERGR